MVKGDIIWKSYLEHNPQGKLFGNPYYYITEIDKVYYLWEWNVEKNEYVSLKSSTDFSNLNEEGMELQRKLDIILFPQSSDYEI